MFEQMAVVGTATNLSAGWCWLEAVCVSTFGEEEGTLVARECPAWVGISLWMWAMEEAAEA